MAVPSVITDLNVSAVSNSPAGTDPVGSTLDDFMRAYSAIIRREQAQGAAIVSASTTNIGANTDGNYIHVTGTTTITSFGAIAAGVSRTVVFDDSLTLTHNATSLILPGAANIVTSAGDIAEFVSEGSGNWRCVKYISGSIASSVVGTSRNLKMSITTASASGTMTADQIVVAAALNGSQYILSNFNKTINISGTSVGGMDTGSAPTSGYVAVYAIYNPTSGVSGLIGVNATSVVAPEIYGGANMPAGYTASALISVWPTNASRQFVAGGQVDREVSPPSASILNTSAVTGASFTSTPLTAAPKNAKTISGHMNVVNATAGSQSSLALSATVAGIGVKTLSALVAGTTFNISSEFSGLTISTPQVLFYSTQGGGTPAFQATLISYSF